MQHSTTHSDDPAMVREWLRGHFSALESVNEKVNHNYSFSLRELPGTCIKTGFETELRDHWQAMGNRCPINFEYLVCESQEAISAALNNWVFRYVDDPDGEHLLDQGTRFVISQSETFENYRKIFIQNLTETIIKIARPDEIVDVRVKSDDPYLRFEGHEFLLSSKHGNNVLTLGEYF